MLRISKHCAERFAERIMGRDEKLSINTYIAQNESKINERINKMYEYGEKIYEGKTKEDGSFVHIFFNNPWVLLTDRKEEVAITLYKVEVVSADTDEDEELNKLFVDSRIKKLRAIKDDIEKYNAAQEEETKEFREEIEENKDEIKALEDRIMALKKRNEGLQQSIDYGGARASELQEKLRHTIEEMVGAKILKR